MLEEIDPRSPTPLYEQIAARIRMAVASGEVAPGEKLPSVRALARRLRVNPATVVQAYGELEAEGFVERRHGAGTFALAVPRERKVEERRQRAREIARRALLQAGRAGISPRELARALSEEADGGRPPPETPDATALEETGPGRGTPGGTAPGETDVPAPSGSTAEAP